VRFLQRIRDGTNVLQRFLQGHHKLFLVRLVATTTKKHDLLVTAAAHRLESNDDWDILCETILPQVDLVVFCGDVALRLSIVCRTVYTA